MARVERPRLQMSTISFKLNLLAYYLIEFGLNLLVIYSTDMFICTKHLVLKNLEPSFLYTLQ